MIVLLWARLDDLKVGDVVPANQKPSTAEHGLVALQDEVPGRGIAQHGSG